MKAMFLDASRDLRHVTSVRELAEQWREFKVEVRQRRMILQFRQAPRLGTTLQNTQKQRRGRLHLRQNGELDGQNDEIDPLLHRFPARGQFVVKLKDPRV